MRTRYAATAAHGRTAGHQHPQHVSFALARLAEADEPVPYSSDFAEGCCEFRQWLSTDRRWECADQIAAVSAPTAILANLSGPTSSPAADQHRDQCPPAPCWAATAPTPLYRSRNRRFIWSKTANAAASTHPAMMPKVRSSNKVMPKVAINTLAPRHSYSR
jgi:hypothetical protein